ncbi:hypothetical protein ACSQ67_017145 [Phaseolus vulgaris]
MASSILKLFLSSIILYTMLQPYTKALRKASMLIFNSLSDYSLRLSIQTYIVYLGEHSHGPNPSLRDLNSATNSHHDLLASVLGSHEKAKEVVMYSYNKHINGFAAQLEEEEASEIAKNPNVISVFLSKEYKLHTTRSWDFLGLEKYGGIPAESAWWKANFGENTVIANLDSGIWPEHPSFGDNGYGPLPSTWRGNGGASLNRGLPSRKFYRLVHAANAGLPNATVNDARLCKPGTLDITKIKGNILICIRRDKTTSVAQGYEAANAGAVGVFVVNNDKSGNTLLAEPYTIPGANLNGYENEESEWFEKGGFDKNNSRFHSMVQFWIHTQFLKLR